MRDEKIKIAVTLSGYDNIGLSSTEAGVARRSQCESNIMSILYLPGGKSHATNVSELQL